MSAAANIRGPTVALIAAVARNGVIGLAGHMPWHLSTDLKHFRELTWGKPVIMGRRTYASIGRPLPGREVVVVTRNRDFEAEGVHVAWSLDEAVRVAEAFALRLQSDEIIIAGGGEIYAEALGIARRLYLTEVALEPEGDTHFPPLGPEWREISRLDVKAGPKDSADMVFIRLEREGA
jgi:dihydrofolate reductase